MSEEKAPAEKLSTDEPTTQGSAREAEAGQHVAGTEPRPGHPDADPTPPADDVAPTTDAPDVAAAAEESGGEGLVRDA
ncbi:hypothetical protein RDV89_15195 [Nocardioides zeae]|uniref:Uncharacterized protein n=1 Tax=Nocardioides imazamoxiresistens TaxID=3231893 RepID=A0ABU3PYT7_9ACTN|nr:hypothetical protein [Nocardioides zeae]MDT9594428.1 hypothetical protein [Nocardioides zeae]